MQVDCDRNFQPSDSAFSIDKTVCLFANALSCKVT